MIGSGRQGWSKGGENSHNRRFSIASRAPFILLICILFIALPGLGTLADDVLTIDGHTFEFLGVVYNDDGTSTWAYRVTSGEKPSLSHWVIELDPSIGEENVLKASEDFEVGKDPTTGIYGLKFNESYKDDETREIEFVLDKWYQAGKTRIAIKAGKDVEIGEPISGPTGEGGDGNTPPVAVDDEASTYEGKYVKVSVLANDEDPDGDALDLIEVTQPENGTAKISGKKVKYTPDKGFVGNDSFAYTISDGNGGTANATVTIEVKRVNTPPHANADEAMTRENRAVEINVLENDTDSDGTIDPGSVTIVKEPRHGSVDVDPETGAVTYIPDPDQCKNDYFQYTVADSEGTVSNKAKVTIEVACNEPPVADNDEATTEAGSPVNIDILANDSDGDGSINRASVAIVKDPKEGAVNVNPTTGIVTYTPDPGSCGSDYFEYTVEDDDGAVSDKARVTVTIICNEPPVARDDKASTDENASIGINVLANDEDHDGRIDPTTVTITEPPEAGTVSVHPRTGVITYTPEPRTYGEDSFAYTVSDDDGVVSNEAEVKVLVICAPPPVASDDLYTAPEGGTIKIDSPGVLANDRHAPMTELTAILVDDVKHGRLTLNPDGSFIYVHDGSETEEDVFTYKANDGINDSNAATVNIAITPTNDPPVANDDQGSTDEDTTVRIDVLVNDTDPDGNRLSVDSVSEPRNGTAVNNGREIAYTPDPDFNGIDSFTYVVTDGNGGSDEATVTITVDPINDPPFAQDDTAGTDEDTPVVIQILGNDLDPDGDQLTIQSVEQPANGWVDNNEEWVTYTPDADFNGTDTFAYTVSDGNGGTAIAEVTVSVAMVNEAPVAQDDAATTGEDMPVTVSVLDNDSDPDEDRLTIESLTRPVHGTAVRSGESVIYTPTRDSNGTDSFTYTVSDGNGGTATARVEITIAPINDPPVGRDDATATVEDTPTTVDVLVNDSDVDGDALTVGSVSQPDNGTVVNDGDAVTYEPDPEFNGVDRFTYTVADGNGGTATATVTVTVTPTNDPPVAQDDSAVTDEGTLVTIPVLDNDSDPDKDFLLVESISQPGYGSVLNGKTAISYIPDEGFSGVDSFTYVVSDGNGGTAAATVTVSVAAVNDPPLAQGDGAVTDEGTPVTIPVLSNDADPDGDRLTVESVEAPEHGTASTDETDVIYTPEAGFSGVVTFSYTVSDGKGGTSTADVVVAVAAVNGPPTAQDDSATTGAGTPVTIDSLANDSDPDGDPLTIALFTQPANGSVTNDGGAFIYTPADDFAGTDTFNYTISDGNGGADTATVTIGVTPAIGGGGGTSGSSAACEGKVIINEVAWAGTAADPRDEWIELRNLGTSPVDLTGWTIRWRRTRPTSAEEQEWKVVELSGVIPGAAVPACEEATSTAAPSIHFLKEDPSGIPWLVTSEPEEGAGGYYTIERRDDKTVEGVKAGVVYDTSRTFDLDLSDRGEVIALFDANGNLVDTANASYLGRDGWAAGSAGTFATMERTTPLRPDTADNWHTNTGIVTRGLDEKGRPVTGTAGAPNSPALASLEELAGIEPATVRAGETVKVDFPLPRQERRETGWPWVSVDRPGFGKLAGGGGGLDMSVYSFSGRYEDGETYALDIDTSNLAPGRHIFWIVFGQGKALLVPIVVTP